MGPDGLVECLRRLTKLTNRFVFEGFHFHLSGYGYESRAQALHELADYLHEARRLGLHPRIMDIGGGLPIRYVGSQEYERFLDGQRKDHYRNGRVPESFYPYGSRIDACEWLKLLLESPWEGGSPIARFLNTQNLSLAIEPGRSLADQAAISVFRVTRVKTLAGGNHVIFVEGSSFSACETWFSSEFLVDPILVSTESGDERDGFPVRAFIAGHSCLEDDVITNRLITFGKCPKAGDLLIYANTAGYQMDLLENEFHRHPMPSRIAVVCGPAGAVNVSPDDHTE
jgi:diaminopimelate decarboxylase